MQIPRRNNRLYRQASQGLAIRFSAYLARMLMRLNRQNWTWNRLEAGLLLITIGLALWPVWMNAYFLTNDGPCHLYNARILKDMLLGHDQAFYGEWLTLNPDIEPNWLNHFLLTVFQLVLPPILSEKLFLTAYILGFAAAFRYLAGSVYPENRSFQLLGLPFMFHAVFLMGFFNFSASVVLFFVVVGYWLRLRSQLGAAPSRRAWRSWTGLGLLMLVLLLAHPVSYCMAMGLIACQWLGEGTALLLRKAERAQLHAQLRRAGLAAGVGLPSLALLAVFLLRQATHSTPGHYKTSHLYHDFLELKALALFQDHEKPWPIVLSIGIGLLVVAGVTRLRKRQPFYEGILLIFGLSIFAYFMQPAQVGGVGIVPERLQFYPYLLALCWVVTLPWPRWVTRGSAVLGFALTAILFSVRLPDYAISSAAVEEFVSVQDHMRPYTSVVTLNYAPEGRFPDNGPVLGKRAFIFFHVTEYLGAVAPHIHLNNYEANTKWFPLRWRPERDPYVHLADGPGFEGWLPTADFRKFHGATGHEVDYVITWCLPDEFRALEGVQLMQDRLQADYNEIFVSQGKRVRLWERKTMVLDSR